MATGTGKWFPLALTSAFNKEIDILDDVIKISLHTVTLVINQDTFQYKSQLTNEVPNGSGYATGGLVVANDTITYNAATNVWKYDFDDVIWPAASFTARQAVVYDSTPATDATRPLLGYIVFDSDVIASGGNFEINIDAAGFLSATAL
jgi:hypothetical protein